MKKRVLLFVLLASALTVAANEYIDPETKVVYTYDPKGTTAAVKAGYDMPPFDDEGSRSGIITDGGEIEYYPGSPEASGDIVILDKFVVDGKEYTVTAIGIRAFYECKNITSVVIPQTVTTIDYLAFASCRSLAKVYSMIEEPFEICCFDGLASPSTLYVPAGTKSKYETTMGWTVFDNIEEMDVTGINGDDVSPTLYNSWVLVSYGNETNEVKKESEGYYYLVTFHTDGRYSGQAYCNEMFGEYQCKGNEITLSRPEMTQVYYLNSDPDEFFLAHLHDVSSYKIVNKELRLYFSGDQYFKFRLKDDNSMPDAITIHRTSKTKSNGIYNLQGRRIETSNFFDERSGKAERKLQTSKLNQGVYIENGRKVVVK